RGGRSVPEAPADRSYRLVPIAHGRPVGAARRDARGIDASDRAGQGACARSLQLQRLASGGGAARERAAPMAALPKPAAALQSLRPQRLRDQSRAGMRAAAARGNHLLLAREWISHREIPHGGRLRQESARLWNEALPERARTTHSRGVG